MNLEESARSFLEHPEWLGACVWVVSMTTVCIAVAKFVERRRRMRVPGAAFPAKPATWSNDAALLVALAAICTALLGPRVGERTVLMPNTGTDVVFLIDVSRSMGATDVPPTRLDRARRAVETTIGRLVPGDRAALAVFASRGVLLTPLTPDRNALVDLLEDIDPGLIDAASSNVSAGIGAALTAFEAASDRPRVIVIASDGEDSQRHGDSGGAAAAREKTRIVALGLGTDAGGHIPDAGGVYRDRAGEPVHTRRDSGRLEGLAAATGGRVFLGDEWGRFDFGGVADFVGRESAGSDGSAERRIPAVRVMPFAALAFAILLLEGVIPGRGFRRRAGSLRAFLRLRRLAAGTALVMSLWCVSGLFVSAPAQGVDPSALPSPEEIRGMEDVVRRFPRDARARIRLGIAFFAIGSSEDAAREFLAATLHARDPAVAATAHFDLGVAALAQSEFLRARDAFFDALALDANDERARFNLEWVLELLRHADDRATSRLGESRDSAHPTKTRCRSTSRKNPHRLPLQPSLIRTGLAG